MHVVSEPSVKISRQKPKTISEYPIHEPIRLSKNTTPKQTPKTTPAKQLYESITLTKKTIPKQKTQNRSKSTQPQLYEPVTLSKNTNIKPLNMISLSVAGAFITGTVCLWGMGTYVASIPRVLSGAGNTVITQVKTPLAMSSATPYDGQTSFTAWKDVHSDTVGNVQALDAKLDQAIAANDGYIDETTMAVVADAKDAAAAAIPAEGEFVSEQNSVAALDGAYKQLDDALNTVMVQSDEARAAEQARIEREQKLSVLTSGIDASDWSDEKISFVAEWGPRVDAYLSGRPLCGYGEYFAAAAYDYDVDPRIGAAISVIESGGGAATFRPFNAWGWMSGTNWSSWEESIPDWTRMFQDGYGYDMDYSDCQRYCPPNPGYHDKLHGQMDQI